MARPIQTYFGIGDAKGNISTVTIPIPDSTAIADVAGFVTAMAALLEPLCTGTLREAGFTIPVSFTPWAVAQSISDVQEKARFGFRTVNKFLKSLSIPTFLESLFNPGAKTVNTGDTDVAALVTAMESGITVNTHTVAPCDLRGEDITDLETAVEEWGRSRG
jgi:hypothetical protein